MDGGSGGRWISTWAKRDPDEPHVHLGPLAVDASLQGQGIGALIMQEHFRRLDGAREVRCLEADKPENVRFYERFGFEVVGEQAVLGIPNWFTRRSRGPIPARRANSAAAAARPTERTPAAGSALQLHCETAG